ncbi:uncharacterized protein IL334_001617 [Kwoniella shivajii]|uniref:AAA+ ATPase domain-containing protein n=1 Tax=Kwoniella shivajii TaxID=564305 RepID=A0ABZ1CSM6_9TREE|nr:hypothetical protein IL334_001617 [Kwoniella shivajii]
MAGSTKRSRQDDNDTPTPSTFTPSSSSMIPENTTPTPTSTPPVTRNNSSFLPSRRQATITTTSTNDTTPGSSSIARPHLTRSSATQQPPPRNNALSRSNSLFNITTRRSGTSSSASSSSSTFAVPTSSGSSGRVGMLTRTQSTPSIVSPSQLKATTSAAGGSGGTTGKGGPEDLGLGGGPSRRFGKGKENIPPKKDDENENSQDGSSRKRPRVSSRGSMSGRSTGRGRSGSVVSVRSETSGRHSSLAPTSSTSSICSWSARLPSPAPSQASSAAQSLDSATSADPLDLIKDEEDDFDLGRTPTKARPVTRSTILPPTPPPSSPSLRNEEIKTTAERVGLMRVYSDKTEVDVEMTDGEKEDRKLNPYKQLKSFLRLSASSPITGTASVDQTIVGREEEKKALRSYLTNVTDVDVGMYVSGPPGTGKTALVTALGRELTEAGWKVIELGCMGLKMADIWRRLGEELNCGKAEKDVKEYMNRDGARVFIILDEIDSLMPPPPSIAPPATSHLLTKLFSLPLISNTIKLVAISNTLDLTLRARLVLPDSAQPSILPFKAYGAAEMGPIVNARITAAKVEGIKVDPTATMLLAKKVEAQNGDLRMCLGVLSSAVTLAEAEWIKKTNAAAISEPEKVVPITKVAVTHILKALTSYTQQLKASAGSSSSGSSSATGKKIRSVQLQGKMVLVSILIYLTRSRMGLNGCPSIGSGQITPPLTPSKSSSSSSSSISSSTSNELNLNTQNLYATYSYLLLHHSSPFPPAPESDYRDLLSNLETLGLISLINGNGSNGMTRSSSGSSRTKSSMIGGGGGKIELCVREDEVKEGLGLLYGQQKGIAEEEVKKIWEREESKIQRIKEKSKIILADGTADMD